MDRIQVDWLQAAWSLCDIMAAFVLALPVGWEREKEHRGAGVRTLPLVAAASCCYILVAQRLLGLKDPNVDRVLQGLITGVGFIGGGAIFKSGDTVRGTATAASIWLVGALGAAVAARAYDLAVILSIINFGALRLLFPVKKAIDSEAEQDHRQV